MDWATLKHHLIGLKIESVRQLFIWNGKISLKLELLNFWHIGPPYLTYFTYLHLSSFIRQIHFKVWGFVLCSIEHEAKHSSKVVEETTITKFCPIIGLSASCCRCLSEVLSRKWGHHVMRSFVNQHNPTSNQNVCWIAKRQQLSFLFFLSPWIPFFISFSAILLPIVVLCTNTTCITASHYTITCKICQNKRGERK